MSKTILNNKVDIVIPLGTGSKYNDIELRHCLRSICIYAKNYRNIVIIGECPKWLQNVIHIPFKELSDIPSYNIIDKLYIAVQSNIVSDNFVYFNDDYFLFKSVDLLKLPFYYNGPLVESITKEENWYNEYLKNTEIVLLKHDKRLLNFDVHYPMIINKDVFNKFILKYDFYFKLKVKILFKSLYVNTFFDENYYFISDCKIRGEKTLGDFKDFINKGKNNGNFIFSTGDKCLENNANLLEIQAMYPNKSIYETE